MKIYRDLTGDGRIEDPFVDSGTEADAADENDDAEADAALGVLFDTVGAFYRAGNSFSWQEWMAAGSQLRAVALQVGELVREQDMRAGAAALAMCMGANPSMIAAMLEDDEAKVQIAEAEIVAKMARAQALHGGF